MSEIRVEVRGPDGELEYDLRVAERDMAYTLGFELLRSGPGRSIFVRGEGEPDEYLLPGGLQAFSVRVASGSKDPFQHIRDHFARKTGFGTD